MKVRISPGLSRQVHCMSPEYAELFVVPKRAWLLEKRTPLLALFLAEHGLAEPKSVKYAPLVGCSQLNCFRNVEAQVQRAGGQMQTGWIFYEFIDICIKSEAHAIWITPQGKRHDITPQELYPDNGKVLFSPDSAVAKKRGYTTHAKTILSTDPRVMAIERFDTAFAALLERHFVRMGEYIDLPSEEMSQIEESSGLPHEVALYMVENPSMCAPD